MFLAIVNDVIVAGLGKSLTALKVGKKLPSFPRIISSFPGPTNLLLFGGR